MKLTEIQRKFITAKLGVTAREKKILHIRSDAEKKDDAITGALDDYLRREGKVFETVRELEKVPGTEKLVAAFEVEIAEVQARVKSAARDTGDQVLKQAYKDLDDIKDRARKEAETGEKNPTYFAELDAVQKALQALKAHPQKAHVQGEIDATEQELEAAAKANDKRKYPDALAKVREAKKHCDAGKGFADQFNAYRIARAPTVAILANMKGAFADATLWDKYNGKLTKADTAADTPTRAYAKATGVVGTVKTEMGDTLKGWTKDSLQEQIDELNKVTQLAFVAAEIKQLEDLRDSVDGKIASGEWTGMNLLTVRAVEIRVAATDRATRRQGYVEAKKKATDAIAKLKPNPAVAKKAEAMEKILSDSAEPLATAKEQRFEEAIDLCKKVEADCAELAKVAATAKKFEKDKVALEKRLAVLELLPTAPHMGDAIVSLKALQTEAVQRVTPGVEDWDGGLLWLARMSTDLAAAEALAKSLTGAAGAHEEAEGATDEASIKKAVAKIRAEAKKLEKPPHNDLVEHELTHISGSCDEALSQAAGGHLDIAQIPLKGASELLVTALNVKGLHANFGKIHEAAEKRRASLQKAAKEPAFKAIKAKVDLIEPMLDQAKKEAGDRNYAAASATIGNASVALKEAADDVDAMKTFDAGATEVRKALKTAKGDDKTQLEELLAKAAKEAEDLRFEAAAKLLSEAEANVEAMKVKTLIKTNRNSPKLVESAKEMLKREGGAALLDKIVNQMRGEENFDVIAKLAKERFGITLTSDEQHKTASARAIWEVMAAVPEKHAANNPSLKSVKREDPSSGGGAYDWVKKEVIMNGRPNDGRVEKYDDATHLKAAGPDSTNPEYAAYAPVDPAPVDLFKSAVQHEVGHSVDDRLSFMSNRAGQAAFGGWKQYTDLAEIAKAVAAAKKYDVNYVVQLLNGYTPEVPPVPATYAGGEAAWKKAQAAVDEWHQLATKSEIWYDYGKSKKAAIGGVVYQEAYANQWVSYLLAERAKGITGYQWRAAGEWFAELYMAYHSKKLQPSHPFVKGWLEGL